jgi:hypothetical protein
LEVFWIAGAVAIIAWTQAKEEITREFRERLQRASDSTENIVLRKVAHMLTCEFCFSFWVSLLSLFVFRHRVAYADWRGVILAQFATWGIANIYMTAYSRLRVDIRKDQIEIKKEEAKIEDGQSKDHPGDGQLKTPTLLVPADSKLQVVKLFRLVTIPTSPLYPS